MGARAGAAEAAIFDAHLALLADSALLEPARRAVDDGAAAAAAWQDAAEAAARAFEASDDEYLCARADDVRDVARRVLTHLVAVREADAPQASGIVVAAELTPGQTAGFDRDRSAASPPPAAARPRTPPSLRARSGSPPWSGSDRPCSRCRRARRCCSTAARAR